MVKFQQEQVATFIGIHNFSKINATMKLRIKNAIERRLMIDPVKYGNPLRKTLKGYRKLRVGDYRIVYKIENEYIFILGIRHRKEIYKKAELRI